MRKTLEDIIGAIEGSIIMTPIILDAIDAMGDAKVPQNWIYDPTGAEISWLLPFLGAWFTSFTERYQ